VEGKDRFSPQEQWQAHAFYQANAKLNLGGSLYHVAGLPGGNVPTYNRFDANVIWQAARTVEARLALRNLFDPGHLEYSATDGPTASQVPRSVYGSLTVRF
jgi:outer membrane receptor protein involved in Fe transport